MVNLTEAPNFGLEEPEFNNPTDTSTGKPRSIILLFQIMQLGFSINSNNLNAQIIINDKLQNFEIIGLCSGACL